MAWNIPIREQIELELHDIECLLEGREILKCPAHHNVEISITTDVRYEDLARRDDDDDGSEASEQGPA